ncbi:MAG: ATP-binding protein, partial [Planctomycetota bacterium]
MPPEGGMGGLSDAMVGKFGMATLAEGLMPYLSVTPTLVPTFAALVKRETPPAGAEPIEGDAVHAVACHLMRALAAEKPLLWVVDDLHFAEPDSRQIVLALARALEDHRVVLLLTSEPGLPEDELSHMSRLPSFGRVPLSRLGARDVIELLKNAFRSEGLAVRLGGMIALKSDGVPFFVFEMIRGLKEGKFLKELPDGTVVETQVIEDIEVPSAVRDLVEARLRDLTDEDRNFLDVAAVQGYVFESDVLARICEVKRVEVLQRLAKLERHSGVLRAEGRGYRFDHHQIREVVYRDLTPELREEYHALVAEAIAEREGATGKNPEEVPGDVAHAVALHHLKGSRRREALPFLEPALEHLANAYRNDAALELADRALRAEGLLAGAERVEVLLKKSGRLSHLGRRDDQREVLDEALAQADATGQALPRAKARSSLGSLLLNLSDYAAARIRCREARDLAREAGDRKVEAGALNNLGNIHREQGAYEAARERYDRAIEI